MANFDGANFVLKATCPSNEIILDDKGLPSIMVYVPKFKISEVLEGGSDSTHPAFIVNGREVPGVYISKYQNVVYNNRAYSLPGEDPKVSITFDQARQACEAKGPGWHLMTNAEWAALALWCRKNNCMPKGNNDFGKDSTETGYIAVPASYGSDGRVNRVRTGTGPKTWSHNGEADGIYDLNGNVYEWVGGYRTVDGEIQIIPNNDAADQTKSQAEDSMEWKAILQNGTLVEPGTKGTLKYDYVSGVPENGARAPFQLAQSLTYPQTAEQTGLGAILFQNLGAATDVNVPDIMKLLALYPADSGSHGSDIGAMRNQGERFICRGGPWDSRSETGIFNFYGSGARTMVSSYRGFRLAYIA